MKPVQIIALAALALAVGLGGLSGCASSSQQASNSKAYSLKTCLVTDDALDKDAFVFVHHGQEIKLCCEGCREDFNKEPDKYLKKLAGK